MDGKNVTVDELKKALEVFNFDFETIEKATKEKEDSAKDKVEGEKEGEDDIDEVEKAKLKKAEDDAAEDKAKKELEGKEKEDSAADKKEDKAEMKKALETVNSIPDLIKAAVEEGLQKAVDAATAPLKAQIENLEKADLGIRSVMAGTKTLKKAFEIDGDTGAKTLSKSQHKHEILDVMSVELNKGNKDYTNAIMNFEAGSVLSKAIVDDLSAKGFKIIE